MGNPHVLVIPYPAQGHVIPLMELSQHLVKHELRVTFVNTDYNHDRIMLAMASWENNIEDGIKLVSVPDGLDSPEDRSRPGKLSEAILRLLPSKVEELIDRLNCRSETERISCVIADQSLGWALEIAEKKGIRRAAFCPAAAAQLVLALSIPRLIDDGIVTEDGTPTYLKGKQNFQLAPDMPTVSADNFVWARVGNLIMQKYIFELMLKNVQSVKLAQRIICNSTYELEPGAFALAPHIQPIGPLLGPSHLRHSEAGSFWPRDSTCLNWLDEQAPGSVIYVAFGSFTTFDPRQFQELAMGLEITGMPFLWVLGPESSKLPNPEGWADRVAERSKIVRWAAQRDILSHPSVGCFITHCGWNSVMEGVSSGVPFLCWPYFADQFFNKSYVCDVWGVGFGFDRTEEEGIVSKEEIKKKVEMVLGDEKFKAKVLSLQKIMRASVEEGGQSYNNFKSLVEWLKG